MNLHDKFIQNHFVSITEVFTVGYPFCGFKILSGVAIDQLYNDGFLHVFSISLIILGIVDIVINSVNLVTLLAGYGRKLEPCAFATLTLIFSKRSDQSQRFTWQDFGNSIDVLLSLTLIAVVIGAGLLKTLTPNELLAWNISVIFNVLGAGLGRFLRSLKSLSSQS